jgi:hypothetical protein
MTHDDMLLLIEFVGELANRINEQTSDKLSHALLLTSNGDEVTVEFLGETIYSSDDDGGDVEEAKTVIVQRINETTDAVEMIAI